jgi:hypothetical protein
LRAWRSDHSGQRGAAGTIRAIEECFPLGQTGRCPVASNTPRARALYDGVRLHPAMPATKAATPAKRTLWVREVTHDAFHLVSRRAGQSYSSGFRRLKAYKHCPLSELRLQLINPSTSPNELNTMLTPHSMIHGDACSPYNIWGIP